MTTATFLHRLVHQLRRTAESRQLDDTLDNVLLDRLQKNGDPEAFATIVRRHGDRVLAVCRKVLSCEADVEDAFQAVFVVLFQNAGSIRQRQALSGWLCGVAHRIALKARTKAARRQRAEQRPQPATTEGPDFSWREACAILHEELDRLPDKYRLPLILCYLEGRSRDEAAQQLGVNMAVLRGQLGRGRDRLRRRLTKRGIALSAGLLAAATNSMTAAVVPERLVRAALEAATGGQLSATVAALLHGASSAALLGKLKLLTAAVLAGCLLSGFGVWLFGASAFVAERQGPPANAVTQAAHESAQPAAEKKPVQGANEEKKDTVEVSGLVLMPDGKPAAGAKLFICERDGKSVAPQPATDSDGRFRFALAAAAVPNPCSLLAMADGLGLDWVDIQPTESNRDLTLRLPAEAPIRGKVVDLEGKPVAGAAVRVVELTTTEAGTLDEFLKRWAADKEKLWTGPAFRLLCEKQLWSREALRQLSAARTGPDGTFRLTGIGRDRGLMLGVRGPGIADHYVRVVTRPDFPAHPMGQGQVALSGPELAVAVGPSKPIMGTLRDAQTKEPLAGVRVLAYTPDWPIHWWWQPVETVTDAQGRYRLDGLAKTARQIVTFDPGAGASHMHRFAEVGDTEGLAPIVHDAELHRGVVIRGQVTDQSTGRPVRARVVYAPLLNNGNFNTTPGYAPPQTQFRSLWVDSREMVTGADGRFRLTALPGPGALFVRAVAGAGQFTQPSVPKEERDPAIYHAEGEVFMTLGLGDIFPMAHLHAYRLIRPAADTTALTADFALDPGLRRKGRLLDPDGRPLSGAEAVNLTPPSDWKRVLPGAEFTAEALNPAKPRRLLFWHRDRKLAGTVVLRGDEPDPITVTLQPLAALTGRAMLKNGEPLVGYAVEYSAWPELAWPGRDKRLQREPLLTDKEGRFRITDLPAGLPLTLSVIAPKTRFAVIYRKKIILESGKTEDLGDLRGEPQKP
jgi:RNA polymerase sigma factor (sigma-70 family)